MTERLPDNLATLHEAFGKEAISELFSGESFTVAGVEFVCQYLPASTSDRFYIVKPPPLIDRYRRLCAGPWHGRNIVELGIAEGGSTALLALLAAPKKLVAVDLEPRPLQALSDFVAEHGFAASVRPYYGIDQADRARLADLVDSELAGDRLDVVIDDASHQLGPTTASFEVLFPRLRPGGVFVIEDWRSAHTMKDAIRSVLSDPSSPYHEQTKRRIQQARDDEPGRRASSPQPPLSRLAVQMMLARASIGDAVESVTVDHFWLTITRGDADLDPTTFRVADLYHDYFGYLPPVD